MQLFLIVLSIGMLAVNLLATLSSASYGHSENQSIVQQFTSDGNILTLVRKASPIGEKHSTICKFFLTLSMKYRYIYAGVPSFDLPSAFAATRIFSKTSAFSSAANKLGTSKVFSKLFMSSTNDS